MKKLIIATIVFSALLAWGMVSLAEAGEYPVLDGDYVQLPYHPDGYKFVDPQGYTWIIGEQAIDEHDLIQVLTDALEFIEDAQYDEANTYTVYGFSPNLRSEVDRAQDAIRAAQGMLERAQREKEYYQRKTELHKRIKKIIGILKGE
jgi:hypothetical protein